MSTRDRVTSENHTEIHGFADQRLIDRSRSARPGDIDNVIDFGTLLAGQGLPRRATIRPACCRLRTHTYECCDDGNTADSDYVAGV
jgi:hypothetical protein